MRWITAIVLACGVVCSSAWATVPAYFSYSGYLEDNGAAVNGAVTAIFEIYSDPSFGTVQWTETHNSVAVQQGEFVVELGALTPLSSSLLSGDQLWLQVTVNGEILQPRLALNSVPYAFRSLVCSEAEMVPWSAIDSVPETLLDGDQDTKPNQSCSSGHFLSWNGSQFVCVAEADPKIGALTADRWCRSDGTQVVCDIPAASCATKTMSNASCGGGTGHMRVIICTCQGGYSGGGTFQCVNGTWSRVSGQSSCNRDSCFVGGSQVLLANGLLANIEDVTVGTRLRSASGDVNTVIDLDRPVLWPHKKQRLVAINGGPFHMTDNHPVLTAQGWKAIAPESAQQEAWDLLQGRVGQLRIGDMILGQNPVVVRHIAVKNSPQPIKLYNFVVDGDHTYIVDGMAVMGFVPDRSGCLVAESEHHLLSPLAQWSGARSHK